MQRPGWWESASEDVTSPTHARPPGHGPTKQCHWALWHMPRRSLAKTSAERQPQGFVIVVEIPVPFKTFPQGPAPRASCTPPPTAHRPLRHLASAVRGGPVKEVQPARSQLVYIPHAVGEEHAVIRSVSGVVPCAVTFVTAIALWRWRSKWRQNALPTVEDWHPGCIFRNMWATATATCVHMGTQFMFVRDCGASSHRSCFLLPQTVGGRLGSQKRRMRRRQQ